MHQHIQAGQTMQLNSITPTATLQQRADNGDAQAQFELSYCYACGIEVESNMEQAMYWMQQSAEQGLVGAQMFLGIYHATAKHKMDLGDLLGDKDESIQGDTLMSINKYRLIYHWVTTQKQGYVEPDWYLKFAFDCYFNEVSLNEQSALAFAWFTKAAIQDSAEAQYWLARCYAKEKGREQSDLLAFEWFKKAAEQECAEAYYPLACCYRDGKGIAQNYELAFEWITKASELADAFLEPTTKITPYGSEAAKVYFFLGALYHYGNGVSQSDELAWKWYRKAVRYGAEEAFLLVGDWAAEGKGCEQDYELAFKCYIRADENDVEVQYRLAICYLDGKGVKQNYELGILWGERAAKQGHTEAKKLLAKLYGWIATLHYYGKNGVKQNDEIAFKLFTKAAEQGSATSATAYLFLGMLYESGRGTEQSDQLAFECFKKVIDQNEVAEEESGCIDMANIYLAGCYAQGKGVEKNLELANQHYQQTNPDTLGNCILEGIMKMPPKAKEAKEALPLKLELHNSLEEFEVSRKFVEEVFENANSIEKGYKDICLKNIDQAEELDQKNKELEEKNQQLQQAQKDIEDMMSMFAHKFRSPLDAIIYNTSHDNNPKLYAEAAQTMRGLLDIFSIISTDDTILTEKIKADCQGNARLNTVLSKTLNMILLHLLSASGTEKIQQHYLAYAKAHGKIAASVTNKEWYDEHFELEQALQAEWEQSFAALLSQSAPLAERLAWLEQHFFKLELIGFDCDDIQFKEYAVTESLLTILLNEILVNAFKYYSSETRQAVVLEWSERDGKQILSCRNPSIRRERTTIKGSGKGHTFLSALARKIGGQFSKPKPQDDFVLEFGIPNELLISK